MDVPRLAWLNAKTRPNQLPRKNEPGRKPEHEEAIAYQGGLEGPRHNWEPDFSNGEPAVDDPTV